MATQIEFKIDSLDYNKKIKELIDARPRMARGAMRKVNQQIVREVKREAAGRGYMAVKPMPFGEAGYRANTKQFSNKDFSGKIVFLKNAYHLKFIEYGATVKPRHGKYLTFKVGDNFYKTEGFTIQAQPLIQPIADSYWRNGKADAIMEQYLQQQYDKIVNKPYQGGLK